LLERLINSRMAAMLKPGEARWSRPWLVTVLSCQFSLNSMGYVLFEQADIYVRCLLQLLASGPGAPDGKLASESMDRAMRTGDCSMWRRSAAHAK
jgi:hypothetical protein